MGGPEAKQRFFEPSTADFILEAPSRSFGGEAPLRKIKPLHMFQIRARKVNGKVTELGEDSPEEVAMYRGGTQMAEPEGLFGSGGEFFNIWHACDH
jgi:hypothetical protein